MEIAVYGFVRVADEILAVRYSGDPDEAKLLIANGWLTGADQGFNRDNEGPDVLRGLIGDVVVYPNDIIGFHPNWTLDVFEQPVFMVKYEDRTDVAVLTDGAQDTSEVQALQSVPYGSNPDAVPLENPTPTDQRFGGAATPADPTPTGDSPAPFGGVSVLDSGTSSTTEPTTESGTSATDAPAPVFVTKLEGESFSDYEARLWNFNAVVPVPEQAQGLDEATWSALVPQPGTQPVDETVQPTGDTPEAPTT